MYAHVHRYRCVYVHLCVIAAKLCRSMPSVSMSSSPAAQSQVWGEGGTWWAKVVMQRWTVSTGKCSARAIQGSGDLC